MRRTLFSFFLSSFYLVFIFLSIGSSSLTVMNVIILLWIALWEITKIIFRSASKRSLRHICPVNNERAIPSYFSHSLNLSRKLHVPMARAHARTRVHVRRWLENAGLCKNFLTIPFAKRMRFRSFWVHYARLYKFS